MTVNNIRQAMRHDFASGQGKLQGQLQEMDSLPCFVCLFAVMIAPLALHSTFHSKGKLSVKIHSTIKLTWLGMPYLIDSDTGFIVVHAGQNEVHPTGASGGICH